MFIFYQQVFCWYGKYLCTPNAPNILYNLCRKSISSHGYKITINLSQRNQLNIKWLETFEYCCMSAYNLRIISQWNKDSIYLHGLKVFFEIINYFLLCIVRNFFISSSTDLELLLLPLKLFNFASINILSSYHRNHKIICAKN